MRSRSNLAMVVAAGALAFGLTLVRPAPEGRAAPGETQVQRHDLSALKIFNLTLVRIKERYVDPSRIDPKKMLYSALDSVQFNIPEVLVEPDPARNVVAVAVNDKRQVFDTSDVDSPWRLINKLRQIFKFVETNMNPGADLAKVEYAATNGMLNTLDPHSILMDPEQAADMDVSTGGKFGGLGIIIRKVDNKNLTVVKPMKDTPAWKAGIKAGDHIVRINNDPTENLTSNEAVDRMRGDPKTAVTLWIERKGHDGLMRFDLVRDEIRVANVEHKLLDKGVGYIKVKQFSKYISQDVAKAMKEMQAQGATSWVLDLRYNPGGLLEEAIQLSDLFVDSGNIVTTVSVRDRDERHAERGFGDANGTLAVLVNGGSASASEIVAGALKNLDRAVIIGTRTFGKGTVQELYNNDEDKSKLKLTIAQYLTPGDRSIQNVGIVPDIQLQRMYVPDKNDSPQDYVRMLAPTHVYGEKDLDAAIVSTYAREGDKPAHELAYLFEKKPTATKDESQAPPDDEDDPADDDVIVEDFEMRFARDLVSSVASSKRQKVVAGATPLVAKVRADEEKKLVAALGKIGVDWSAPVANADPANLDVQLQTTPSGTVHAGDMLTLTASVKNTGTGTAYRVLPRIQAEDGIFEDVELPVGKVAPGETKTYTTHLKVPQDAVDRLDRLTLEVKEARNAMVHVAAAELKVEAAPRPVFAYAWQLVDDGNGDGLVQRGEKYRLQVSVKNTGVGPTTDDATVVVKNQTGDGVELPKASMFEIGVLQPGQSKDFEFAVATNNALKADEMVLELAAADSSLDVWASDKLHFRVAGGIDAQPMKGEITTKQAVAIRSGAADDTSVVGSATRGASYSAVASYGGWIKVKLNQAGKLGFIPAAAVSNGGAGNGAYVPSWNTTPPTITLATKALAATTDTFKLEGRVSGETHVEDVYIFVSNPTAKIESRKVFYRSNRGGKDGKSLDFATELPLWPGSNMVTVVARQNADVRTMKTMYVYREPPRTAQTP